MKDKKLNDSHLTKSFRLNPTASVSMNSFHPTVSTAGITSSFAFFSKKQRNECNGITNKLRKKETSRIAYPLHLKVFLSLNGLLHFHYMKVERFHIMSHCSLSHNESGASVTAKHMKKNLSMFSLLKQNYKPLFSAVNLAKQKKSAKRKVFLRTCSLARNQPTETKLKTSVFNQEKFPPKHHEKLRSLSPEDFYLRKAKNFYSSYSKLYEINQMTIQLASPERIRLWAEKILPNQKIIGRVTNANTLHYKTFKPQKNGLFCERIFGPLKDFECACVSGKNKKKTEQKVTNITSWSGLKNPIIDLKNFSWKMKLSANKTIFPNRDNGLQNKNRDEKMVKIPALQKNTVNITTTNDLLKSNIASEFAKGSPLSYSFERRGNMPLPPQNTLLTPPISQLGEQRKEAITGKMVEQRNDESSRDERKFCPECDVEYTWSVVRRYQLGYIQLVAPVTHFWYLKGTPSYLSLLLNIKKRDLEAIIYCSESMTLEAAWNYKPFLAESPSNLFQSWQKTLPSSKPLTTGWNTRNNKKRKKSSGKKKLLSHLFKANSTQKVENSQQNFWPDSKTVSPIIFLSNNNNVTKQNQFFLTLNPTFLKKEAKKKKELLSKFMLLCNLSAPNQFVNCTCNTFLRFFQHFYYPFPSFYHYIALKQKMTTNIHQTWIKMTNSTVFNPPFTCITTGQLYTNDLLAPCLHRLLSHSESIALLRKRNKVERCKPNIEKVPKQKIHFLVLKDVQNKQSTQKTKIEGREKNPRISKNQMNIFQLKSWHQSYKYPQSHFSTFRIKARTYKYSPQSRKKLKSLVQNQQVKNNQINVATKVEKVKNVTVTNSNLCSPYSLLAPCLLRSHCFHYVKASEASDASGTLSLCESKRHSNTTLTKKHLQTMKKLRNSFFIVPQRLQNWRLYTKKLNKRQPKNFALKTSLPFKILQKVKLLSNKPILALFLNQIWKTFYKKCYFLAYVTTKRLFKKTLPPPFRNSFSSDKTLSSVKKSSKSRLSVLSFQTLQTKTWTQTKSALYQSHVKKNNQTKSFFSEHCFSKMFHQKSFLKKKIKFIQTQKKHNHLLVLKNLKALTNFSFRKNQKSFSKIKRLRQMSTLNFVKKYFKKYILKSLFALTTLAKSKSLFLQAFTIKQFIVLKHKHFVKQILRQANPLIKVFVNELKKNILKKKLKSALEQKFFKYIENFPHLRNFSLTKVKVRPLIKNQRERSRRTKRIIAKPVTHTRNKISPKKITQQSYFDLKTDNFNVKIKKLKRNTLLTFQLLQKTPQHLSKKNNFTKVLNEKSIFNNIYTLSHNFTWKKEKDWRSFSFYISSSATYEDLPLFYYKNQIPCYETSDSYFIGAGIIKKLLNEFHAEELKKMDKQNRLQLSEFTKEINNLKKFIRLGLTDKSDELRYRELLQERNKLIRRLKLTRVLYQKKVNPESMILSSLPVLPPDLRPIIKMESQVAASDLNRFYQRILYRNERLKKFLKDPATRYSYEMKFTQRLLQESVDNLISNGKGKITAEKDSRGRPLKSLSDILKGKEGRFRQHLLGKRVDYSGRSVIVVGPKLKLHQCGLPKEMALELFLPFLLKRLIHSRMARTVIGAKALLKTNTTLSLEILTEVMLNHPILLNRAPTLHRLGIQAFQAKLVEGRAILLHPLVCPAFNADFDGDQMAVHIPITIEARAEAWKLMFSRGNLLSPATGDPILLPSQDMVLGCYYLTTENAQYEKSSSSVLLPVALAPCLLHFVESSHCSLSPSESNASEASKASGTLASRAKGRHSLPKNEQSKQYKPAKKAATEKKLTQIYFSNIEQVLKAYSRNVFPQKLHLHSIIWLKYFNQTIENDHENEEPIELRIEQKGFWKEISKKMQQRFDTKNKLVSQYMCTTVGRILFNVMIQKCINN